MDPTEPARQFAERAIKSLQEFSRESDELDRAFLRGRVGDLIKKYSEKYEGPEEESEEADDEDTGGGGTGEATGQLPETD